MSSLSDYMADLTAPFPSDQIDLKPGALTRNKDRAMAMAYADSRVYQDRLDKVVGTAGWSVAYQLGRGLTWNGGTDGSDADGARND